MDDKATTIEYTSTREDLGALYSYLRRHSFKMQCFIVAAVILVGGVPILVSSLASQKPPLLDWIIGSVAGIAVYLILPWNFKRRVKKDKRTLSISPVGITTQVGSKHGQIAWRQVENLWVTPEYVFIVRRNLNSFAVPRRAFRDDQDREMFTHLLQEYWDRSK
jgi:YcxB-like protein